MVPEARAAANPWRAVGGRIARRLARIRVSADRAQARVLTGAWAVVRCRHRDKLQRRSPRSSSAPSGSRARPAPRAGASAKPTRSRQNIARAGGAGEGSGWRAEPGTARPLIALAGSTGVAVRGQAGQAKLVASRGERVFSHQDRGAEWLWSAPIGTIVVGSTVVEPRRPPQGPFPAGGDREMMGNRSA
jgi:hypothetical protein